MKGLFVTGTDTGVGKTVVSTALLVCARRAGLRPIPYKPVETGCDPDPADAQALWRAARPPIAAHEICSYALRLPAAPLQAATAEDVRIDLDRIAARAAELSRLGDFLVAEGAGGLLVPYVDRATTVDLIRRLDLPVLVVARTALGTVNHTALTVRELGRQGLRLAGVILNRTAPEAAPHEADETANSGLIATLTGERPLGVFPHLAPDQRLDADACADALTAAIGHAALNRLLSAPTPA